MDYAEDYLVLAAGKITCRRCTGTSRRTRQQCGAPAEKHSTKCRFHGARATGPVTMEGRLRCADAKARGQNESRAQRRYDRAMMRQVKALGKLLELLQALQK